jgi:hypothetical protein
MKTGFRMAFGLPLNEAIQRLFDCAKEMDATTEKLQMSRANDFGQRLKETMSRMTAHRRRPTQSKAQEEEETFGAKLKLATLARARGVRVTRAA